MNTAKSEVPWVTGVGIFLAVLAIALSLATTSADLGLTLQLLPYFAAASLSAMLLGLAGRARRESIWMCLSSIALGAFGLAIEYTIFAAIITALLLLVSYIGDISSVEWLLEIVIGVIVVLFGLLFAGISLPIILIGVLVIGAIAFLSDFLDFF